MAHDTKIPHGIDLLIVDIDDTFIYHRTVAIANKIFLQEVARLFGTTVPKNQLCTTKTTVLSLIQLGKHIGHWKLTIKQGSRVLYLSAAALLLYTLHFFRRIHNEIQPTLSNEYIVRIWAETVIKLGMPVEEYSLSPDVINRHLKRKVMRIYGELRKQHPQMKVVAISQDFAVANQRKDAIKAALQLTKTYSNKFIPNQEGTIKNYHLLVKNGQDKKKIAEKEIQQSKAKRIGIFIDDYDDLKLLELKGIVFILYHQRLEQYIPVRKGMVTQSFQ
ncbi:hypothetical protein HYW21_05330 [Candidatus Woesearchaeota archaeon]|nr:hypothetical protein [Candidatus Woesearchaeota archaeon]